MAWSAASAASGGQTVPADRRGPGIFAPQLDAGVFFRFLPPPPGRVRVGFEHRPADRRPDLRRRLPGHAFGDDGGFGFRRSRIAQHPGGLGDQLRFVIADHPFGERLPGQWQPGGQIVGERDHPFRGPPGQRERDGGLIGAELVPPGRFPAPGGCFFAGGRGAAGGQFRDRGQPPGRRPRLGFRPPGQDTDELIIVELAVSAGGGGVQRLRQGRAGQAGVERVPGGEPRPGPALLARHRIPRQEPRVQAGVQARRRARINGRHRRVIGPGFLEILGRPPVTATHRPVIGQRPLRQAVIQERGRAAGGRRPARAAGTAGAITGGTPARLTGARGILTALPVSGLPVTGKWLSWHDARPARWIPSHSHSLSNTISNGKCHVRPSFFHWKARAVSSRPTCRFLARGVGGAAGPLI